MDTGWVEGSTGTSFPGGEHRLYYLLTGCLSNYLGGKRVFEAQVK